MCDGRAHCPDGSDEMRCEAADSTAPRKPTREIQQQCVHLAHSSGSSCSEIRTINLHNLCGFCVKTEIIQITIHKHVLSAWCLHNSLTASFYHLQASLSGLSARAASLRCRNGFKPCNDGLECVMYSHVCDGEDDCQDGSDEEGCASRCKAGLCCEL